MNSLYSRYKCRKCIRYSGQLILSFKYIFSWGGLQSPQYIEITFDHTPPIERNAFDYFRVASTLFISSYASHIVFSIKIIQKIAWNNLKRNFIINQPFSLLFPDFLCGPVNKLWTLCMPYSEENKFLSARKRYVHFIILLLFKHNTLSNHNLVLSNHNKCVLVHRVLVQ